MNAPSSDWQQRLASLADLPEAVCMVDAGGRILGANAAFARLAGRAETALTGLSLADLNTADGAPAPQAPDRYRARWQRPDGSRVNVEITAARQSQPGGAACCWVHDITDLIATSHALRRSQDFLQFLIGANALVARSEDADSLYQGLCREAARLDERIALAWVGLLDEASGELRPVAHAGRAGGYLEGLVVSVDAGRAEGQGPGGRALRENRLIVVNRFNQDATTIPWHAQAQRYGLVANASLPFRRRNQPVGALMLYSTEPDVFDEAMAGLLGDLGVTISHALDYFEQREQTRHATEALLHSELRYRLLADNIRDVIWIYDPGLARFVYVSPSVERLWGYTEIEAMAMSLDQVMTPASAALARQWLTEDLAAWEAGCYQPRTVEVEQYHRNGDLVWAEISAQLVVGEDGRLQVYGVSRDITSRRRAERQFREIVDLATEGIAMIDAQGRLTLVNRRLHDMLGFNEEELLGRSMIDLLAPEDRAAFAERFAEVAAGERRETRDAHYGVSHKDGHRIDVLLSATHRFDDQGRYQGSVGMVTDISPLIATQEALRDALRVVEASPVVRFRWRAEAGWPLSYVSDNISRWGYRPADLLGGKTPYAVLIHPDDLARVGQEVAQHTREGHREYEQEYRVRHADGHYFWVKDRTHVVRDESGEVRYYEGVITDIDASRRHAEDLAEALAYQTELNHRLEEAHNQLLQSEKLASIGQLAAGVAHELNNPIGFVHSNLGSLDTYLKDIFEIVDAYERAEAEMGDRCPQLDHIRALKQRKDYDFLRQDIGQLMSESREGLLRVRKIVQDLKDFSRVGDTNWQWADLHQGLESTLNIVWNELKYKCTVSKDYAADLPPVYCLPSQLNQVFMNLLVNAAQAITVKDGQLGEIAIATRNAGPDAVAIVIRDSGSGIPPDHIPKLFDPFFTTKPVGKGTGLGLSIAWGIVQRHHGAIAVDSTPGVGTTFTITLPVDGGQKDAVPPGLTSETH